MVNENSARLKHVAMPIVSTLIEPAVTVTDRCVLKFKEHRQRDIDVPVSKARAIIDQVSRQSC
jgi:hypothetical protein